MIREIIAYAAGVRGGMRAHLPDFVSSNSHTLMIIGIISTFLGVGIELNRLLYGDDFSLFGLDDFFFWFGLFLVFISAVAWN